MSKKLIIAFSALALAILAGAIAVVGVFAAQQQKVANTFTISYTANNVSMQIGGMYLYKDGTLGGGFSYGNESGIITPDMAEQTGTMSLPNNINLTAQNGGVIINFWMFNTASPGGNKIQVTVTDTSVRENVKIYYLAGLNAMGAFDYEEVAVEANLVNQTTEFSRTFVMDTLVYNETSGYNETQDWVVSFVIEIDDDTLDASYVSTATAGIHFTFESIEG